MDIDIQYKIKEVLKQKHFSEKDVVYFLVESYKFLERKYDKEFGEGKYNQIKFYRNWASHATLYGDSHKVFKDIGKLIKEEMSKSDASGHFDWSNSMADRIQKSFRDYGPVNLEKDISNFFLEIEYNGKFNWESLRSSLYEVIRDIPLAIKDEDKVIFSFKCIAPITNLKYDSLNMEAVIENHVFSFVLDDRSL